MQRISRRQIRLLRETVAFSSDAAAGIAGLLSAAYVALGADIVLPAAKTFPLEVRPQSRPHCKSTAERHAVRFHSRERVWAATLH